MKKKALLIIDVQCAMFCSAENTSVYEADRVLNNICMLLEKARSSQVPVIFIQHTDENDQEYAEGLETWELHPRLAPLDVEKVVRKSTWDSFHQTKLQEELQKQDIEQLIIAGMQTEFCLDTTCRRAFSMGYESILAMDAHTTFDGSVLSAKQMIDHHNSLLGGRFVKLEKTVEIEL